MTTLITSEVCYQHEQGGNHYECPQRLEIILARLEAEGILAEFNTVDSFEASEKHILAAHSKSLIEYLEKASPTSGYYELGPDTLMNPYTLLAAKQAAGSGIRAVDLILDKVDNVIFSATRPPGHHAEREQSMGFCIYNNAAIAALYALSKPSINRVAVIDFDVHHCNGTVDIFKNDDRVIVCSSSQEGIYPNINKDINRNNIILTEFPEGCKGAQFCGAVESIWQKEIDLFKPDLIIVSAGFDAHRDDPLAGLCLQDDDYSWLGNFILSLSEKYCRGRVISFLEGGYNLQALAGSCFSYLSAIHKQN